MISQKLIAFVKGFARNVTADPVSSVKGIVSLAAGAVVGYGVFTGKVPASIGVPAATKFATDGIHALGTDSTGAEAPMAAKLEAYVHGVSEVAANPDLISAYHGLAKEAADAQQVVDRHADVVATLSKLLMAQSATAAPAAESVTGPELESAPDGTKF